MLSQPRLLTILILAISLFSTGLMAQQPIGELNAGIREKDPVLRSDGKELFFSRLNHVSNKGTDNAADVWIRTRHDDGSWGRALNPGSPVNSFAHDRVVALSPDGTHLAVLRNGITNYLDLLEKNERNWRVLASWPIPEGVAPRYDLTFDLNGQRMIYSSYGGGGILDLFVRTAESDGTWSGAKNLSLLNSDDNETTPQMAADGRTLYFRQGDRWLQQTDANQPARVTDIPGRIQQFAVPAGQYAIASDAVVMINDLGNEEQLMTQPFSAASLPPASKMVRGYLAAPPLPGELTALVPLTNRTKLSVSPDAALRYELFLRSGEELVTGAGGAATAAAREGEAAGTASLGDVGLSVNNDRLRLEAGITNRELTLQQLDAERRKYDLARPKTTDPELDALREQYDRNIETPTDTIPKGTTAKGANIRDRYAKDLTELERMKAKFRKQQDEKVRQRSGGGYEWIGKEAPTATTRPAAAPATYSPSVPSITDSYTSPPTVDPRLAAERARRDSMNLGSTVRSGLYPDQRPRAYERESWENELSRDLPRNTPLSPDEVIRLDAEYQRQQGELAALKAELRRLNETAPTPSAPATAPRPTWTAKGSPYQPARTTPQPSTYNRPALTTPSTTTRPQTYSAPPATTAPGISAGISFISNTAYPDGVGYDGLDQLLKQLGESTVPLELRIHTSTDLDRRAAQLLSEERATTIRRFLEENGVPAHTYRLIGFGNNLTGSGGERVEVLKK